MRKQHGTITGGPLRGARATFVRRLNSGFVVILINAIGAYKPGDLVHLGTGEWRRD